MQRSQNSPIHRSDLLCGDLSGGTKSVNRNSLLSGTPHRSQPLEPRSPGERNSSPTTSIFMVPMLAPDGNLRMFHLMTPMPAGCYAEPCAPNLPQSSGYYHVDDNGFPAHVYDPFMHAYQQPLGAAMNFGGMTTESIAVQPSIPPPATPEESIPSNPAFYYHPCRWLSGPRCDGQAPGRNREMGEHLRSFHRFIGHERDSVQCDWEGCGQIIQRMNVPRHIVSRHLLAAANCRFCRKRFSRPDVVARHERTCNVAPPASTSSTPRI